MDFFAEKKVFTKWNTLARADTKKTLKKVVGHNHNTFLCYGFHKHVIALYTDLQTIQIYAHFSLVHHCCMLHLY